MATAMLSSSLAGRSVVSRSALRSTGSRSMVVVRAERDVWYPGAKAPKHLNGTMPGDHGFDPLRMGANAELLPWYREAELTNGRWAMAAVAGILFTDLVGLPKFWLAGAEKYPIATGPLIAIEVALMAVLEYKRLEGWRKTGGSGVLSFFPFDPMGMNSVEMQKKEIANGRLAMVAFVGFCSQAAVRGLGPIDCLKAHLADPGHVNIYTSAVGAEATVAAIAIAITPIIIEAKNSLDSGTDEEFRPIPW